MANGKSVLVSYAVVSFALTVSGGIHVWAVGEILTHGKDIAASKAVEAVKAIYENEEREEMRARLIRIEERQIMSIQKIDANAAALAALRGG